MGPHTSSEYFVAECAPLDSVKARTAGARACHLQEMLRELDEHASEPDFRLEVVATKLGVSTRYLRRLLQETGKTFSAHRTERRLDRASALLTDPASRHLSVTQIALLSGFGDISHFNHCFRQRFGVTPTGVRDSKTQEAQTHDAEIMIEC